MGYLSPKELYKWHVECGLIQDHRVPENVKPASPSSRLDAIPYMQDVFENLGIDQDVNDYQPPAKGVLFLGPDSNAKNLIAQAIARKLGWACDVSLCIEEKPVVRDANASRIHQLPNSQNIEAPPMNINDLCKVATHLQKAIKTPCVIYLDYPPVNYIQYRQIIDFFAEELKTINQKILVIFHLPNVETYYPPLNLRADFSKCISIPDIPQKEINPLRTILGAPIMPEKHPLDIPKENWVSPSP